MAIRFAEADARPMGRAARGVRGMQLRDGDEVVLAGAYELMLASSGTVTKGGHFHADGTFHADEQERRP